MLNKVMLMGRLTSDPELRQTPNGTMTTQFTVAVERSYANENGERQADFINVVAWRQTAEFVTRYFGKGRMICIEGNLRTRTYKDTRYPDVTHYVTEVYADQVHFTGEKKQDGNGNGNGGNYQQQPNYQNNGGNNGNYQQQSRPQNNGYNNNNYQQQPQNNGYNGNYQQQQQQPPQQYFDPNGFEEVIGDGDLPF